MILLRTDHPCLWVGHHMRWTAMTSTTCKVSSDGRKMTSATAITTKDHNRDDQPLPIATVKSEPTFKYQAARLFGIDAASATEPLRASSSLNRRAGDSI
jgi:hypothetical protein